MEQVKYNYFFSDLGIWIDSVGSISHQVSGRGELYGLEPGSELEAFGLVVDYSTIGPRRP